VDPGVSPELVLVDPALADDERRRLSAPEDTLDRLAASAPLRNGHAVEALAREDGRQAAPEPPPAASPGPPLPAIPHPPATARVEARRLRRPQTRVRLVAATLGAVALAVLFVLALTSLAPRDEAGVVDKTASTVSTSPGTVGEKVPTSTGGKPQRGARNSSEPRGAGTRRTPPQTGRSARPPASESASEERRLAWAPVEGASRYHVELFDGRSRVFSADTTRPQIVLPASWRLDGRTYRLAPGEYLWYVWPVASGRRATEAIVQARLDIPR
jgi:hypothetical protein